jgi:hypothetical protein
VKAIFREYTDATFTTPKKRSYEEVHLGIVGPPIKVEVGDNMQVVFMNKASRPYSFNPFGLAFTKDNEGALYKNKRYSKLEFAVSDFINNRKCKLIQLCNCGLYVTYPLTTMDS